MADVLKNIFGGAKPEQPAAAKPDSDFADFAGAPDPVPEAATLTGLASQPTSDVVWTKWYNIHERHSLSEFKPEGIILVIATFIFLFHVFGTRANRSKARAWIKAHAPAMKSEFASVGFRGVPTLDADFDAKSFVKEKSLFEFASYATGRQNVAFMDVKITLAKRFNPFFNYIEMGLSLLTDTFAAPEDFVEATIYPFDGKEELTLPPPAGGVEGRPKDGKSTYDGFVWAIVNKSGMQKLRDDRYDVSLTATKDNSKLPEWLTVMSESAEITDTFLTSELIEAVRKAGDLFDYVIISDQPIDKPTRLEETAPRKRVFLKYRLPSNNNYDQFLPLFEQFLRIPDALVKDAHFRPEVLKRVRATREAMIAQLKKAIEEEKNEERQLEKEKAKKAKRDADLKGLDAKAQKKYLEKEKEKELRKSQKRMTMRG
ncbi:hypothetical protein Trco_000433 [Trichoderma cornu-damae]|uniref:DUF1682-domain-containing protein n=1 Tax=Trichoderma cornu-damae TaxID=654480 RepID=A0A9P8QW47_9HYPO|nr:hypothetical protein Trco_000433 [Trichoderma cornu-damae]